MQYSADGKIWGFPTNCPFNPDKIAKSLGLKLGDFIYYREREGDVVRRFKYGVKYGK